MTVEDLDAAVAHAGDVWDDLSESRLFVTGGTGFLGVWLVSTLLRANETKKLGLAVTALTRSTARFAERFPELAANPNLQLVQGDVRFFHYPPGRFTHLVHAAVDTSAAADAKKLELFDTIVDGTRRVLAFSRAAGVRKALLLSSGAVYGPQPAGLDRIPETFSGACETTDARSTYGEAKRAAETLFTLFDAPDFETTIARCFAFVGPHMDVEGHFAIGNFIRDAVAGQPIRLTSDGTPVRSHLYAGDAAAWLLRILIFGRSATVYNVGSGEPVTLAEAARRVAAASTGTVTLGPADGGLRSRYVPDVTRARAELGLDVWTSLDDAISSTVQWLRAASRSPSVGTPPAAQSKKFVIDVDGVVASISPNNDYTVATPLTSTIAAINRLYDAGHRIIMFTARGSETGIDWHELTASQLREWGLKFHELHCGKPSADYYVDDRMLSVNELDKLAGML